MAYSEQLANRIREQFAPLGNVIEKTMMGGLTFMYNDKMCVGVIGDEMMCRIDPTREEEALENNGCRQMDFTTRTMKGYIMVEEQGMKTNKQFEYWIGLALEFNPKAKSSKKKK